MKPDLDEIIGNYALRFLNLLLKIHSSWNVNQEKSEEAKKTSLVTPGIITISYQVTMGPFIAFETFNISYKNPTKKTYIAV